MKTLKILFVSGFMFLALQHQANAQMVPFDYTGLSQEAINSPDSWDNSYYGSRYNGSLNWAASINGQEGQDLYGAREQVVFDQPTNISAIDYTVYADQMVSSTVDFVYNLNGVTSAPVFFTTNPDYPGDPSLLTLTGSIPLNVDMAPGTYWLTEVGTATASGGYTTTQGYTDPMGTMVAPEPSTWALLILGVFLFIILRRYGTILKRII